MAHLGEQAITAERQHDHADRLLDGGDVLALSNGALAKILSGIASRLFVDGHRNGRAIREAAERLGVL